MSAKRPFAGPVQVLVNLSRYTHRVALSSGRLLATDRTSVTFAHKDCADGTITAGTARPNHLPVPAVCPFCQCTAD